nr:hypothetical protein [Streptomyces sp. SID4917]
MRERFPDTTFTHRVILEGGDKDRKSLLSRVSAVSGGSAFSTEQEAALVRGEVDVIVHSLKDLPTANPRGLMLLPPPAREDVADALCGSTLAGLRKGAKVGTGAPRRIAQLLAVRPDLDTGRARWEFRSARTTRPSARFCPQSETWPLIPR